MGWIQGAHITKRKEFARPLTEILINIKYLIKRILNVR
jgi:hypothetical protein